MKLLNQNNEESLSKINDLIPCKQISFGEALLEYFDPFWRAHSLPDDWLSVNTSHYATETKPMFQGAVIYGQIHSYELWKHSIKELFANHNWSWRLQGANCRGNATNRIYNRAGCFEFFDIAKAGDGNLVNYMCGKSYDLIIFLDVEIDQQTILSLIPVLKEGNTNRVFNLKY